MGGRAGVRERASEGRDRVAREGRERVAREGRDRDRDRDRRSGCWEKRTTRDADVGRSPDALRRGAETRRVAIERRTHKSMSRRFRDLHSWMMSSSSRSSSSVKLSLSSTSCRGGGRAGRGGGGRERQRGKARVLGTSRAGAATGSLASRRDARLPPEARRREERRRREVARARRGAPRPAGLRRAPRARPAEDPRGRALVPAGEIRTPGVPARGRDRARSRGASNAPRRERTVPAPATSKTSRRADRTRARCVRAPSRSAAPPRTARALKTRRQIARQKGRQGEKGGRRSRRPIGAADRRSVRNRNRRFKIETDAQRLV